MPKSITVEVVFASPQRQHLQTLVVADGSTIAEVLAESQFVAEFPLENLEALAVGIWGRAANRMDCVHDGDRVEVYRALKIDPRKARRKLAESGRTMKQG